MGAYINPQNGQSKEQWLATEAYEGPNTEPPTREDFDNCKEMNLLIVCLVSNGLFTAAGIAYDEREFEDMLEPSDTRPKQWYTVEVKKLLDLKVSSLAHYYTQPASS